MVHSARDLGSGRLLVATPQIADANFERTVVLLIEHGEDGSLGLVLNRPSVVELAEPLPAWAAVASEPAVVFVGGPVEPARAIGLGRAHRSDDGGGHPASFEPLADGVGTLDLDDDPAVVAAHLDAVRVFAGYAGWGPGQLAGELSHGAWWVVDCRPGDVFSDRPEQLWRTVLARQPGGLARFARYPDDPSVN